MNFIYKTTIEVHEAGEIGLLTMSPLLCTIDRMFCFAYTTNPGEKRLPALRNDVVVPGRLDLLVAGTGAGAD